MELLLQLDVKRKILNAILNIKTKVAEKSHIQGISRIATRRSSVTSRSKRKNNAVDGLSQRPEAAMRLLLVADGHYYMTKDGRVYAQSVFDSNFYKRYTDVFEEIYAVIRADDVASAPENSVLSSAGGVTFLKLKEFKGPVGYLKNFFALKKAYKDYADICDCAIFRIPGAISMSLLKEFVKTGKRFAVEMVADPYDMLAPGSYKSIFRPFIRFSWHRRAKKYCRKAAGCAYVTKEYLQRRYPSKYRLSNGAEGMESSYSSVSIPDESGPQPKDYSGKKKFIVSHVANSFSGYGKGHVTLIKAAKVLTDKGYDVEVSFIGDGPLKAEFKLLAEKLGISERIRFAGRISERKELLDTLASTDIFALPTRSEGLPRSVIEAMSVGLPCVSSPVGGVPELLDKRWLVPPDDHILLAEKIEELIADTALMNELSKAYIAKASEYKEGKLSQKRKEFYLKLRGLFEKEIKSR